MSTGGRDSESLELSGFSCGTIGSTLVSGTFDDELDFLSELDFDLGASGFAGTEGFSADFLEDELDDELLDFFFSTGGNFSDSLELSSDFGFTGSGNFSDSLELLDDFGLEGSVTGGFSGIEGGTSGLSLSDFFCSLLSLELSDPSLISGFTGGTSFLLDELLDDFLLLGDSNLGSGTEGLGDSRLGFSSLSELESDGNSGLVGSVTGGFSGSTGINGFSLDFLLELLDDESLLLGDSTTGFFTSSLSELELDFLSAGFMSVGFFAEELEEDDELFDFFFSISGFFSDSLELSEESALIGSVSVGFAGSIGVTDGWSFGIDLCESELEEDFFRSGDLTGGIGSTFSFGDSGFLSSLSSELESLDDFFGSTCAGGLGELGFEGTFSFLDDSDEELLDFFFSTGGSFSDLLDELEEDFGLAGFFSSLSELELEDLIFSTGLRGSVGGSIGSSFTSGFLLDELLEDLTLFGESILGSDLGLGESALGVFLSSELDDEELFGFCGLAGSTFGDFSPSFLSDLSDDELEEDFFSFGDSSLGLSSGFLISSLSELESDSLEIGIVGSEGSIG